MLKANEKTAHTMSLGVTSGLKHHSVLTHSLLSTVGYISTAFIFTAKTGLNYRHYKRGKIPKHEFWR